MSRHFAFIAVGVLLCAVVPWACSANSDAIDTGSTGGSGGGGGTFFTIGGSGGGSDLINQPPTANCGDGHLDDDEACDDGNQASDDGCGGNCRYIEKGFVCPDAGKPCRHYAKCGDGIMVFPEQCDDGGVAAGDGCSATCKVEVGFKCDGSPSACTHTVCGDGVIEGAETCDDGNSMPFDGCSDKCQAEPSCTGSGCTSACGDGIVLGAEECDDGNTVDGDGCSSTCTTEDGYTCGSGNGQCEMVADVCALRLPMIVRDFSEAHSDFGVGCGTLVPGVASATLNAQGKPTLARADNSDVCIASAASFGEWYTKAPSDNSEILKEIVLFDNGTGAYVNRLDNNGTRYQRPPPSPGYQWCSDQSNQCAACPAGYDACLPTCTPWGNQQTCAHYPDNAAPVYIDGNPMFFPIDGDPNLLPAHDSGVACIPQEIYGGGWQNDPTGALREFHFTTEVVYWFEYHTGDTAFLSFVGDDDVWVYINRHLAVDLGGLHVPKEGTFRLNANGSVDLSRDAANATDPPVTSTSSASAFGLTDGGVYEIRVFQAERKKCGSSFRLTLEGFNTSRSDCTPVCGDGILAAGEQCDDGVENNIGGHDRCSADCTLGAYCGDGIVQAPDEQCDDADPNAPSNCAGCHLIILK